MKKEKKHDTLAVITDTQTGGHGNFMTNPAQRANLLKIYTFSMHEKYPRKKFLRKSNLLKQPA